MKTDSKKTIALFLVSQNISLFGSQVAGYAIIWYITLETSSGIWLMLSTICSMLPQAIISLWGGVWADRYNRKMLIMFADGFIALATLGLAVAFGAGGSSMGLLLAVSAVRSTGAGIQTPAVNAVYPQLVSHEQLTRVQGINQTIGSVCMLAAPALGGLVLGSAGIVWAFMIDVITACVAILIMVFIPITHVTRTETPASVICDLKEGVSYSLRHPLLRRILICYACSFFLFTPAATLAPLLIERTFGGEIQYLTINQIVWASGSIAGGIYVSLHGTFENKTKVIAVSLALFGAAFVLQGVSSGFILYQVFIGIAGFILPLVVTNQTVYIQETADASMLGRVFSLIQIISVSAMPVAILIFGPLADIVSVQTILIISGVLLILVGAVYGRGNHKILHL